jgi:hypothetical protein
MAALVIKTASSRQPTAMPGPVLAGGLTGNKNPFSNEGVFL